MALGYLDDSKLTAIADSIRSKTGKSATMTVDEMPDEIESIETGGGGDDAVKGIIDKSIENLTLPATLTSIGNYAFYGCSKLKISKLPSGITTIGNEAFRTCKALAITELPNTVRTIGSAAFAECTSLEISRLPDNLTYIQSSVFLQCKSIVSIESSARITTITAGSFNGNATNKMNLERVSFPNMVVGSIGSVFGSATANNACQKLSFADIGTVNSISANAFANCYQLETLVLRKSDSFTTISNVSAFTNTPARGHEGKKCTVYVPQSRISSYENATNWKTFYNNGTVEFLPIEGSEYEL